MNVTFQNIKTSWTSIICKITNFLWIFFNRKKIRKIRYILRMKKIRKIRILDLWSRLTQQLLATRCWRHGTRIAVDNLVSRHFGPRTLRHHQTGAKVCGQFGTNAEVSHGRNTLALVPNCLDLQLTFFATTGHTKGRFNITHYYY